MGTLLTVYSYSAFKRFLLPAINDADYSIFLSESLFNLSKSVELKLEISDGIWHFLPSEDYELEYLHSREECYYKPIEEYSPSEQKEFRLRIDGQHVISIIVRVADDYFSTYTHYGLLPGGQSVTIGRNASNTICFDYQEMNLVSGRHASITSAGDAYFFRDGGSSNGSYVNNQRVSDAVKLEFGDSIDIF